MGAAIQSQRTFARSLTTGVSLVLLLVTCSPQRPIAIQTPTPNAEGVGAQGMGDRYFPTMGNGGYDVQHYTLDLTPDLERRTLAGTVSLETTATQDLTRFNLDFLGFEILALTVDGRPASYARDSGELTITPAEPISRGATFTVAVTYRGAPNQAAPAGQRAYARGWVFYEGGAYVASEPDGASAWFPVNMHPLDKATYTFRLMVARPNVVVANGVLVDTIDGGDTRTYVWEARDPMAAYLVTVAVGEFEEQTFTTSGGVPIRNYFAPGLPETQIELHAGTSEMLDYYASVFGPYPFEAYGVVVHNLPLGFALESQTLSLFGIETRGVQVVAHELAHQWFGDSVTLARWEDVWLNEGFATYASLLCLEHFAGSEPFEEQIRTTYWTMNTANGGRTILIGDPGPADLFDHAVYLRGALALHALRQQVGDEPFFRILRTYASRFRDGNATTGDFVALAEDISGQDLARFFERWLYAERVPFVSGWGAEP